MRRHILFVIFVILCLVSFVAFKVYESSINCAENEYVKLEGVMYKEVWNGKKDCVLETSSYFGRVLLKGVSRDMNVTRVSVSGTLTSPERERNPEGFNQAAFLAGKNIYHILEVKQTEKKDGIPFSIRAFGSYMRSGTESAITELMGDDRGFIIGVMTGDTSALDSDEKSSIRLSGISHLLAVSGMHVGYVLMPFKAGVKRKRIGLATRTVICVLPLLLFAVLTGLSPSVVRAVSMTAYMLSAKAAKGKADYLTGIGLGGIICLLLYPMAIADTGFILSFGAVISAYAIIPILKKHRKKESRFFNLISFGLAVNIGLFPISIYKFGTVAPAGILLTLIAAPLSAALCVFGYITAFLYMIPVTRYLGTALSYGLKTVARLMNFVSENGAKLPVLRLPVYFAYIAAAVYIGTAVIILKPKRIYKAAAAILCLASITLFTVKIIERNEAKILWLDVGQGSCAFVRTEGGKNLLFDGGNGYTDICEILRKNGYFTLDAIVLSHGDSDHIEGIFDAVKNLTVDNLILSDNPGDKNAAELKKTAEEKGINIIEIERNTTISLDDNTRMDVYFYRDISSLNNSSLVVQLTSNEGSAVFPGDLEFEGEKKLSESGFICDCDILTASHHGSKGATGNTLLDVTKPELTVISVGKKNRYGHPNEEMLRRLEERNIFYLRTDRDGAVKATFDESEIKVKTWLTRRSITIKKYRKE